MPVISLEKVSKKYHISDKHDHPFSFGKKKEIVALKDITFQVERGEVVGVIGTNGSGKSTLLKILSRVTPPSSGQAEITGKILALLEVGVGFHPELTGRENIMLNGSILGMSKEETLGRMDDIIDFSGIKDFIDMQVKKYSSGMYVRLAFSIAASMDPDLLFIDEVLALGDINFQNKCFNYINGAAKNEGKTVMIVSHNLEFIQKLCHKCIWLDKGTIKASGETNEVLDSYLNRVDNNQSTRLSQREDRGGSGKIRVTNVLYQDESGNQVDYFLSGQTAVFKIEYEANDPSITEFEAAFAIDSHEIKERICNNFSETINKKIRVSAPKGHFKLRINRLPLNIGKYYFNLWLINDGEEYDVVLRAGMFKVMFGDFYRTGSLPPANHGIILMDFDYE